MQHQWLDTLDQDLFDLRLFRLYNSKKFQQTPEETCVPVILHSSPAQKTNTVSKHLRVVLNPWGGNKLFGNSLARAPAGRKEGVAFFFDDSPH